MDDTCAWTPNSVLIMSLLVYLGATFALQKIVVTGVRFLYTCYKPANHWAYLANQQIIGFHCFRLTRAYIWPALPTSKSWIRLLQAYSGLHQAYFANQQIIGFHC